MPNSQVPQNPFDPNNLYSQPQNNGLPPLPENPQQNTISNGLPPLPQNFQQQPNQNIIQGSLQQPVYVPPGQGTNNIQPIKPFEKKKIFQYLPNPAPKGIDNNHADQAFIDVSKNNINITSKLKSSSGFINFLIFDILIITLVIFISSIFGLGKNQFYSIFSKYIPIEQIPYINKLVKQPNELISDSFKYIYPFGNYEKISLNIIYSTKEQSTGNTININLSADIVSNTLKNGTGDLNMSVGGIIQRGVASVNLPEAIQFETINPTETENYTSYKLSNSAKQLLTASLQSNSELGYIAANFLQDEGKFVRKVQTQTKSKVDLSTLQETFDTTLGNFSNYSEISFKPREYVNDSSKIVISALIDQTKLETTMKSFLSLSKNNISTIIKNSCSGVNSSSNECIVLLLLSSFSTNDLSYNNLNYNILGTKFYIEPSSNALSKLVTTIQITDKNNTNSNFTINFSSEYSELQDGYKVNKPLQYEEAK